MSEYTLFEGTMPLIRGAVDTMFVLADEIESYAAKNNLDPNSFVTARLIDDMLGFNFQVFAICDSASDKMLGYMHDIEQPNPGRHWDDIKTLDDVRSRLKDARDALNKCEKAKFIKRHNEVMVFRPGWNPEVTTTGYGYMYGYVLPNTFFHLTTAYNILRKEGIPLGKPYFQDQYLPQYLIHTPNGSKANGTKVNGNSQ